MKEGKLLYASSAVDADILYASGFHAHDPFWYFSVGERHGVVVSKLEADRAAKEAVPGLEILEIGDVAGKPSASQDDVADGLSRMLGVAEWRVPAAFPCMLADKMRCRGLSVVPISGLFFPERRAKSADEIAAVGKGLALAEKAMGRVVDILSDSSVDVNGVLSFEGETLTSERLKFEIAVTVLRGGGGGDSPIVACGLAASRPHDAGAGPILAGEPIVVDIFPRGATDYHGDITRTFVKGAAGEAVVKAFNAVREARDDTKGLVRAGIPCAELHVHAANILKRHGFETGKRDGVNFGFFHGLGHGVGLDVHENPRVSEFSKDILREGDVITIEPGLYYPEWGGVRLEDMVAVGKSGGVFLTDFPTFLEVK